MPALKHPAEQVRQKATELLHEHHGNLSLHEFSRLSHIPVSVIQLRLGPWLKFKKQLGHSSKPAHSPESLLEQLRQLVERDGPEIRLIDFTAATGHNEKTVTRAFGTWRNFRTQAGLAPNPRPRTRIPPEAFLADIFQIRMTTNHSCSRADYQRRGSTDLQTLEKHFGSWEVAMQVYGTFVQNLMQNNPTGDEIQNQISSYLTQLPPRRHPRPHSPFGLLNPNS